MKSDTSLIYWDSCLFLSYINGEPGRAEIVEAIWDEIDRDKNRVITSTIAIVEVAYANHERANKMLSLDIETRIDAMWSDPNISLVELNYQIAAIAKDLIRDAIPNGWSLRSKDAIHLASALWINRNVLPVKEFFTYDTSLQKYQAMIGIHINEPHVAQPKLL